MFHFQGGIRDWDRLIYLKSPVILFYWLISSLNDWNTTVDILLSWWYKMVWSNNELTSEGIRVLICLKSVWGTDELSCKGIWLLLCGESVRVTDESISKETRLLIYLGSVWGTKELSSKRIRLLIVWGGFEVLMSEAVKQYMDFIDSKRKHLQKSKSWLLLIKNKWVECMIFMK